MTTKDQHLLTFWYQKLWDLNQQEARYVSVGEVAKFVGQSKETARKYLKRLQKEKVVDVAKRQHANKIRFDVYHVITGDQQ